jgi:hypothetical protein
MELRQNAVLADKRPCASGRGDIGCAGFEPVT